MDEQSFKLQADRLIAQFYASAELEECRTGLIELNTPQYHPQFVKKLVSSALDGTQSRCELASGLLRHLCSQNSITVDAVAAGFMRLAHSVEDLTLDVPRAPVLIAGFIARGVKDGVLPADFAANLVRHQAAGSERARQVSLDSLELHRQVSAKSQVMRVQPAQIRPRQVGLLARAKLKLHQQRKRRSSLVRCAVLPAKRFAAGFCGTQNHGAAEGVGHHNSKRLHGASSAEPSCSERGLCCQASSELQPAAREIWALGSPHFHHEVVKQIISLAYGAQEAQRAGLLKLFHALVSSATISREQVIQGLDRCLQRLDESQQQHPSAPTVLASFRESARRCGVAVDSMDSSTLPEAATVGSPPAADFSGLQAANSSQAGHQSEPAGDLQVALAALASLKDPNAGVVWSTNLLLRSPGAVSHFVSLALRSDSLGEGDEIVDVLRELAESEAVSPEEIELAFCHALTRELHDASHGRWLAKCFAGLVAARVLSPVSIATVSAACSEAPNPEHAANVLRGADQMWRGLCAENKTGKSGKGLRRAQHHASRGRAELEKEIAETVAKLAGGASIELVAQRLAEMNTPYMAPEVVSAVVRLNSETGANVLSVCALFISGLCANGVLSQGQLSSGLQRAVHLDGSCVHSAAELITVLLDEGTISPSQLHQLPESLRVTVSI